MGAFACLLWPEFLLPVLIAQGCVSRGSGFPEAAGVREVPLAEAWWPVGVDCGFLPQWWLWSALGQGGWWPEQTKPTHW